MTYSRHSFTLAARDGTAAGAPLAAVAAELTLDERSSPYVSASFEIARPDSDTRELLQARGGGIQGAAQVDYRDPVTAADVTGYAGGAPVTAADITAAMADGTPASITAALSAWGNSTEKPSALLPFQLRINRITPSGPGRLRIDASSDEIRLQEFHYFGEGAIFAAGSSVRALVRQVIGTVVLYQVLESGPDATLAEQMTWMGGVTAWDFIDAALQPHGLTLQCLPTGRWRLITANAAPTVTVALDRLTGYEPTDSRDGWADVVLVSYRWRDALGGEQVMSDLATSGGGSQQKVLVVEHRDMPYPGPGAAAVILARAAQQGRTAELEAVSDYSIAPGQAVTASPPAEAAFSGRITRATFEWPQNRMRLAAQS